MANRAMNAKVERARRQARELGRAEYSKPFYQGNYALTGTAREHAHQETAALVAAYTGKITRIPCQGRAPERMRSTVCLGEATEGRAALVYGTPVRSAIRYNHDTTSRLIPAR